MRLQELLLWLRIATYIRHGSAAFTVQGSVQDTTRLRNVRGIAVSGSKLYAAFHGYGY